MKIKNLIRVLFRLFGLYTFLKLLFEFLPHQLAYIINSDIYFPFDEKGSVYQTWIYIAVVVFFMILIFYLLIINPDSIINRLRPKEFLDDEVNFSSLNTMSMIKIAILSVGTLILFDSIPTLINGLFLLFKLNQMDDNGVSNINTMNSKIDAVMNGLKVFLGLALIIFNSQIGGNLYKNNVVE